MTGDMGDGREGDERNDVAGFRKAELPAIRLRIIGNSLSPWNLHIVDAETGREISGVMALWIAAEGNDKPVEAELTLTDFDFDIEAMTTARRLGLEPRPYPPSVEMVGDEYGPAVWP